MNYQSTRDTKASPSAVSSAEAIKKGLAPDKGLYMPTEIPHIDKDFIIRLVSLPYHKRAAEVLSLFLTDYDKDALAEDCRNAYGEDRFPGGAAPLRSIGDGTYSLELWHGPTCAFKDMALQIMPRLLSRALTMTGETKKARILVATSGDTGKAALEGYRDVDGVDITVFYPVDGVSPMQKRQMTTQLGSNVNVCAVRGNFDDAQNGVKAIFADENMAKEAEARSYFFSSANSINWGRLAPQIVYYFSAYCDLVCGGEITVGDSVNFCVPTGNFGNIFAAYIARMMGLPVKRLICASNSNCVLTDFIRSGVYDRTREFFKTVSPSMDILISSNLERLLFAAAGAEVTSECMKKLSECGKYRAPEDVMEKIRGVFAGYCCSEEETLATIKKVFNERGYLIDTHTAVAFGSYYKYANDTGDDTPCVIVSTASPYKFARDVSLALGKEPASDEPADILTSLEEVSQTSAPDPLKRTLTMPLRFTDVIDPADMAQYILEH